MAKVRHALPPIVTGTRCVPVLIPDNDAYVSLLLFAIRKMCQQSYFERDENRTAKQVADLLMSVTYQSVLDNIGTGCDTMADCDTIEDCLETSPIISAINTTIKDSTKAIYTNVNDSNYWTSGENISAATRAERISADKMPLPPVGQSCNYDALWGACNSVVTNMDTLCRDWLEQLTASADAIKRAATLVRLIPVVGDFAADVLESVVANAGMIENAYNSFSTDQLLRDLACNLYCQCKADCVPPSIDMIMNTYATLGYYNEGFEDIRALSLASGIAYAFSQGIWYTPAIVFYALNMWTLAVLAIGSYVVGWQGMETVRLWVNVGLNSGDDDWKYYCVECEDVLQCSGTNQEIIFATDYMTDARLHRINGLPDYLIGTTKYTLVQANAELEIFDTYSQPRCWYSIDISAAKSSGTVDLPLKVYVDGTLAGEFTTNNYQTSGVIAATFNFPGGYARGKKIRLEWSKGVLNPAYESWYMKTIKVKYRE